MGIKGIYLDIIKPKYDNPIVDIILNTEKLKSFFPKIRNKTRMPVSPLSFNIVLEALITPIRKKEETKGIQIGKEELKQSLFADDMMLYLENPKDTTRKL